MLTTLVMLAFPWQDFEARSFYLPAEDGTRIAVDAYLPQDREAEQRFPVLVEITRYWRSSEDARLGTPQRRLGALDRHFLSHDYVLAKVDARGSGASFGTRTAEYGRQEVLDGEAVVDGLIAQSWCDGNVGAYGTSYSGTTAEFLCAVQHPAVKAVIPGWSDFDIYESPARPYGLIASGFLGQWSQLVGWMDEGNARMLGGRPCRVDDDEDGSLRDAALREHAANPVVLEAATRAEFRDDEIGGGVCWEDTSSLGWKQQIEDSGVPMLVFASWLDAGTAEGALLRYQHYSNSQKLVIMASNHGGGQHASPFAARGAPFPRPSAQEQFELRRMFFDHYLKSDDQGVEDWPGILYYNLGEEEFRESETWPPEGVSTREWLFGPDHTLIAKQISGDIHPEASRPPGEEQAPSKEPPSKEIDEYTVDFTVSTGAANRWFTQMGAPIRGLDDRAAMNSRMLCYTTAPLADDLQVSGTPSIHLDIASTHADGAFFAYLEAIDTDGRVRYVTEGGLRAIHRKPWTQPPLPVDHPVNSFHRADASPMEPGQRTRIEFRLWPTSMLFAKGTRIRLSLAGADADTFDRLPAEGAPVWMVFRGGGSLLRLPVQD